MEIERKWLVDGWPQGLVPGQTWQMRQGYVCTKPTVRIRAEGPTGGEPQYILCLKGAGGLAREEVETALPPDVFADIETRIIQKPLIEKQRRDYPLPGGLVLEVNLVDEGLPTAFYYAEVEFETEAAALAWQPAGCGLADYLTNEVTAAPGQSMGAYWQRTRG